MTVIVPSTNGVWPPGFVPENWTAVKSKVPTIVVKSRKPAPSEKAGGLGKPKTPWNIPVVGGNGLLKETEFNAGPFSESKMLTVHPSPGSSRSDPKAKKAVMLL